MSNADAAAPAAAAAADRAISAPGVGQGGYASVHSTTAAMQAMGVQQQGQDAYYNRAGHQEGSNPANLPGSPRPWSPASPPHFPVTDDTEEIVDLALHMWNNKRLALSLLHTASLPAARQELFRADAWKPHLVEVLVQTGWRDISDGCVEFMMSREASCLVLFMEIMLGQARPDAPYLRDIIGMGAHVDRLGLRAALTDTEQVAYALAPRAPRLRARTLGPERAAPSAARPSPCC